MPTKTGSPTTLVRTAARSRFARLVNRAATMTSKIAPTVTAAFTLAV